MKVKRRIVPGLGSRSSHRAFISAIARKEIVVDEVEQVSLLKDQPPNNGNDKRKKLKRSVGKKRRRVKKKKKIEWFKLTRLFALITIA